MRFELRLIALAALLIIVIVASCQRQAIAETRRGVLPWERESLRTKALDTPGARDFDFLAGSARANSSATRGPMLART